MASKLIEYDSEARTKIKKGVDKLANAVKVTLGPKGRNVILEKKFGAPTVTCLLYTSPSPRDRQKSRMPSSA